MNDPRFEAVKVELARIFLDYGPNLARLNDTDMDIVAARLVAAAFEGEQKP